MSSLIGPLLESYVSHHHSVQGEGYDRHHINQPATSGNTHTVYNIMFFAQGAMCYLGRVDQLNQSFEKWDTDKIFLSLGMD